jgi:hypothetical protein
MTLNKGTQPNHPPVTICMVTYNAARLLPDTLARLLAVTNYPAAPDGKRDLAQCIEVGEVGVRLSPQRIGERAAVLHPFRGRRQQRRLQPRRGRAPQPVTLAQATRLDDHVRRHRQTPAVSVETT